MHLSVPPTGTTPFQRRTIAEILYLMLKTPAAVAEAIWRQSRALGIDSNYGRDRYHITLLPIGDARYLPQTLLALLLKALSSFQAEPFELALNRLDGNALKGGTMPALDAFQRMLVEHLLTVGFPVDDYDFRPHLSLIYGEWQPRRSAIPPIRWRVEELLLVKSLPGRGRHELVTHVPLETRQYPLF